MKKEVSFYQINKRFDSHTLKMKKSI